MLHGDALVQICTLLTGSAAAGPKVGTVRGPLPVGDELGFVLGVPDGWAEGVGWVWPTGLLLRLASTITPKIPSSNTIATAMAAGTSHGGRSDGTPLGGRVGRGTGLGAGALIGGRVAGGGVVGVLVAVSDTT